MTRKHLLSSILVGLALVPRLLPASAQTTPDNVYLGWDEPSYVVEASGTGVIAGDDWVCGTTNPVSELVWWGSFIDWDDGSQLPPVLPTHFHVAIWTNIPAGVDGPFGHPGTVIWEQNCVGFTWEWVGWDYDPRTETYKVCYRFSQVLDTPFEQPGDDGSYWITIAAVYDTDTIDHPFGWKTRPRDPGSPAPGGAVRVSDPVTANLDQAYVAGEPLEYPAGRSWGLAFELLTPDERKNEQLPDPNLPGLHTHDEDGQPTPGIADNWICPGGDVTEVHWYGNYENNDQGSDIQQFQLSLHANAAGVPWDLPQDPGWFYIVPFSSITETDTGLVNSEGSIIYKYEYVLEEPFVQEQGEKYWFGITAISEDPADPPLWRWQEAQRGALPIIDPAAGYVTGPWQTIQWANPSPPPDYFYSDMAFAIVSSGSGLTKPKWSQPPESYVPVDPRNYAAWQEFYFTPGELGDPLLSGFLADADGDGVPNGAEAVLRTHPRDGSAAQGANALPRGLRSSDDINAPFAVQFQMGEPCLSDVIIRVRASDSLLPAAWAVVAEKEGSNAWTGAANVIEGASAIGRAPVTVEDIVPMGVSTIRFIQTSVELVVP